MVENLHCAPYLGIIDNNHPVFGASLLGTASLIRVALIRFLQSLVRVLQVRAWNYSIRKHSAWSPVASTSFAFFLLLWSDVYGFWIFYCFYPLIV